MRCSDTVNDPRKKLQSAVMSRMRSFARKRFCSSAIVSWDWVGCSTDQLMAHLESFFGSTSFRWENQGHMGWQVDHKAPLSLVRNIEHMKLLCHYTNLMPIWDWENASKGGSLFKPHCRIVCNAGCDEFGCSISPFREGAPESDAYLRSILTSRFQ